MIYFLFLFFTFLVLVFVLYQWQYFLVFSPTYIKDRKGCHECEDVTIESYDGIKLEAMLYEPGNPQATLLFFLGRSDDAVALLPKLVPLYKKYRVVAYNYRGYGKSEGTVTEKALLQDGVRVAEVIMKNYDNVYFVGFSLGSAIASYAATKVAPKGLFLLGAFDSIDALAQERYHFIPKLFIRYHFHTQIFLREVTSKVVVFASKHDQLVPIQHSRVLQQVLKQEDKYIEYEHLEHKELLWDENIVSLIDGEIHER